MTPLEVVRDVARELGEAGVPSPRVDAEFLVAHVLACKRTSLYSSDAEVGHEDLLRLRSLVDRRRSREPLAYVLGEWGFRGLTLKLDSRVLIPRPETEVLVERCLDRLRGIEAPRVLDVGVGSGAIALAIAHENPRARVLAVDRSREALAVAEENLARATVNGRVELRQGNLLAGIPGPFEMVVANPPYIRPEEFEALQPEIRLYEPRRALVGVGVSGAIARSARSVLGAGGWLLLECGDGQAGPLAEALERFGYADVQKTHDLAGRERVVEGQWPKET